MSVQHLTMVPAISLEQNKKDGPQAVFSVIKFVAAYHGDAVAVSRGPATHARIKIQGSSGLLHHPAIQHQFGSDDTGFIWGTLGQASD